MEVDKVLPDKVEKHFFLLHREHHKWYWMSNQEPDEVLLFLSWTPEGHCENAGTWTYSHATDMQNLQDSLDYPPHAASPFNAGTRPRESVEVRIAVFLPE